MPTPPDAGTDAPDESGLPADLWRNVPSNVAPAVVAMADMVCDAVDIPETASGAEVLIIEDAATGDAHIDDGPPVDTHDRDEAHCDAIVRAVRVQQSAVLAWGRRRRTPSPAQIKAIVLRDRCCQMPGCGRTRFLHVHHVAYWSRGGTTDLGNLILLCGEHHRALHQNEFTIVPTALQQFEFRDSRGETIVPTWGGEKLDLSCATDVLSHIWALRAKDAGHAAPNTDRAKAIAA